MVVDVVFIVLSAVILTVLNQYGLLEKHISFALIPILIAYFLGQCSGRLFKLSGRDKTNLD